MPPRPQEAMPLPRELQYGFLDRLMSRFRGARDSCFAVAPLRWRLPGARDLHLLPDASTAAHSERHFKAQRAHRKRSVTSTSSVPRARFAADKASTKKGWPRFSAQVAVPGVAVHEAPYFADRDDFFEQPGCRSPSNSVEFH